MTDQSNTPKPPRGKSLFERAGERFDLGGLRAAPVPDKLQPLPGAPMRTRKVATSDWSVEVPATPAPAATIRAERTEIGAPVEAHRAPAEAVRFAGPRRKVDRELLRNQGFIVPERGASTLFEEFRIVKRQLLQDARAGLVNAQRVLVSSPLPGEGKTFCATNLALAMAAEKDGEVLLVDADFAKPSVLKALGIEEDGKGFMDALSDPAARVEDYVLPTDVEGLFVLPAGKGTTADSEYLASARTAEVLDRLTQGAPNRMVIFDSPPALAASPAADLARHVGQIVLVARADSTGRSAIEDAVALLSSGAAEPKLLLNAARFSPSGRRFGTYYGTGGQP